MGEYARDKKTGERIKIGTCEDMYYLRADQADQVIALEGNVDPVKDRDALRFRFPWPDEDDIAPGHFEDYDKAWTVRGVTAPEIDHYSVQFRHDNGYLVSLPCPESSFYVGESVSIVRAYPDGGVESLAAIKIHRNGYGGAVQLVQQRYWDALLVAVCQCKGCGARYRVPTIQDALPIAQALDDQGQPEIARRVLAGYWVPDVLSVVGDLDGAGSDW